MNVRKLTKLLKKDPADSYLDDLKKPLRDDWVLIEGSVPEQVEEALTASGKKLFQVDGSESSKAEAVTYDTKKYYEVMAQAKYLITDAAFRPFFIKRDGQKLLNLGGNTAFSGNQLKNFVSADLIVSDDPEKLNADFQLGNLSDGRWISSDKLAEELPRFLNDEAAGTPFSSNGKKNVLIYTGRLARNGITSSLLSLLNHLDPDKYNYFLTFRTYQAADHPEILNDIPDGFHLFPIEGRMNGSRKDRIRLGMYRRNLIDADKAQDTLDRLFFNEGRRMFGGARIDDAVQFSGYDYPMIHTFARLKANRSIFAHNDMVKEAKERNAAHIPTLKYAYETYDKVAAVTEDLLPVLRPLCTDQSKLTVVNNTIDDAKIRKLGSQPMAFDEGTSGTHSLEEVKNILANHKVLTTIGRFSPEKGHFRLIDAFEKLAQEELDVYLMIIGGHGKEYEKTLEYAEKRSGRIIILQNLSNPQPFLKASTGFILPSFYEGLGLVLMEAIIQNVPVVSTNISGPRGFMNSVGGKLVEDSEEGVLEGVRLLAQGQVDSLNVDFDQYNQSAVQEFEQLLK